MKNLMFRRRDTDPIKKGYNWVSVFISNAIYIYIFMRLVVAYQKLCKNVLCIIII